ncbi:pyridoxamine 5'-phosphate oxidase family protein [Glaciimonas sp. PAMC28666]|uniref:pyridoxamine 5'-phosphate oxidase family protein n=1 Tax=Glaciimonas sp. PAMC28666 TaxID=2807626 RepID=UPI001962D427|nr:pyridoxamine 5'-phosphate oxidase family protein [Glaciimonas sp. PAMC28666]QRX84058.1 pyridoxamine 5'-phosphate oxidase family protein [Glaciimonas sp. PAMC28666]
MENSETPYPVRKKYRIKRIAKRAHYDKADVNAIIDASYLCHISFTQNNQPSAIPMACWRDGLYIYFHSANKGRLSNQLVGNSVCISIALFDGLVLGHSAFNHSYNYRSVVIHGQVEEVADEPDKEAAMRTFMEHILPGRWSDIRPVSQKELRAITVMRVKLEQVAGKIRDEFPDDETDTPNWPTWIGVIPSITKFHAADADPSRNKVGAPPSYIVEYTGIDGRLRPNKKK